MAFYKSERLALFIDGANLYSAGKTLGVEVDYRKLLDEFRRRGQLIRAYYYTALIENDDYSPSGPSSTGCSTTGSRSSRSRPRNSRIQPAGGG